MNRSSWSLTLVALLAMPGLTGCIADRGAEGLEVRNDTSQTLWIDRDPDFDQNERIEAGPGEQVSVLTRECRDLPIEAQTEAGEAIALLSEEWCPGDLWTVHGPGDAELTDDR